MKFHLTTFSLLFTSLLLSADPIQESIDQAVEAYQAGRLTEAAGQLDYAAQLIREQKGKRIGDALPDAPEGWQAGEVEVEAVNTGFAGSMIQAKRQYTREGDRVNIEVLSDSPMVPQMSMMFNNPALIRQSGAELVRVNGQPAILKDENTKELTMIVAGSVLVTVRGTGEGVTADIVQEFASKIDGAVLTQN